ncbi:hypothetical protein IPZ61_15725 [Streptomyces sioyaensis]|uniref:hypothetical protein n=1 Tax=Streptomyces sioyaensis TaxID=67364 RepID=UPI001F1DAA3F|nr:hypothetical protein [Streptomyces sioyaensis]MCF3174767.1 hypothetical protein [Streptomyces sioyaensis]
MAIYKLTSGHRVRTRALDGGKTEFETRNPEGETISTVALPLEEAQHITKLLRINDALRFAEVFGGGVQR